MSKKLMPLTVISTALILVIGAIIVVFVNNHLSAQRQLKQQAQQLQIDKAKCYAAADEKMIPKPVRTSGESDQQYLNSLPVQTAYLNAAYACKAAYGTSADNPLP